MTGPGPGKGLAHRAAQRPFLSPISHTPHASEGGKCKRECAQQSAHCLGKGPVSVFLRGIGSLGNDSQPDCSLPQC